MKKRSLLIVMLVMLALVTSGFTYAFWAASVTGNNDTAVGSVEIGQGSAVTTTVLVGDETSAGLLVPTGYQNGTTTFNQITLTFDVDWTADASGAAGTTGTLVVDVVETSFDILDDLDVTTGLTDVQIDAMFDVVVTSGNNASMTIGGSQAVVITITFANEPASSAIYDAVANGTFVFDVTFTLGSIVLP
ncbi:MAG: hypothetical protein C4537_07085 [Acholeplasma sp.]|jgi:hypothetical protein|nr:MAG: hypothetical protein C4537_07085 [Acholeplasma sp.]